MEKKRAIFFSFPIGENNSPIRHLQEDMYRRWLAHFFDLEVVQEDCDYAAICDRLSPDIAIFESAKSVGHRRFTIRNTNAHPDIPKVGFARGDAFCNTRAIAINDFLNWGVEAVFWLDLQIRNFLPETGFDVFAIPHFLDGDTYRDYGEPKVVPASIFGAMHPSRPWRVATAESFQKRMATLYAPHDDYVRRDDMQPLTGEAYARMLNRSWFAPADNNFSESFVKKDLEIPACRCCLVAPRVPVMEAMGYRDMENCLLGEPDEVADKAIRLLKSPEDLQRIVDAGHDFVHSRHRLEHRSQIADWLTLRRQRQPGQRIVQDAFAGPLVLTDDASTPTGPKLDERSPFWELMKEGDALAAQKQWRKAYETYDRVNQVIGYSPEPHLAKAKALLHLGMAADALQATLFPGHWRMKYGTGWPEPDGPSEPPPATDATELAWQIIALACAGQIDRADALAKAAQSDGSPGLMVRELARAIWAIGKIRGQTVQEPAHSHPAKQATVHQAPDLTLVVWAGDVADCLKACGKTAAADRLLSR